MGLRWDGEKVKAAVDRAARVGVNRTMALCVAGAKQDHPFTNRTGTAEQSVRIAQVAVTTGSVTRGIWGSVMNTYFKYLEFGTAAMRAKGASSKKRAPQDKNGLPWRGGSWAPTLRPEATLHYPKLAGFIRAAFKEQIS